MAIDCQNDSMVDGSTSLTRVSCACTAYIGREIDREGLTDRR